MKYTILISTFLLFLTGDLSGQYDINQKTWFVDLDEAMRKRERVYNLDLSNRGITTIPDYLLEFPNLVALKLSDNRIESLNSNLAQLRKLEFLEVSGNLIQALDSDILEKLKDSLTELWMRDNRLEIIDTSINVLKYLEVLNLGNNQIHLIHEQVHLPNLIELTLDQNQLTDSPKMIDHAMKLRSLNLNGNHITSVRVSMKHRNLINLNIGDNPINSLEFTDGKYKLRYLVLDWIPIQESWLTQLPNTITTLSLEHCNLNEINDISHLRRLNELSLIANELKTISPAITGLNRLKVLWIRGNDIPESEITELRKRMTVK